MAEHNPNPAVGLVLAAAWSTVDELQRLGVAVGEYSAARDSSARRGLGRAVELLGRGLFLMALDLRSCDIDEKGVRSLVKALRAYEGGGVATINLGDNRALGDKGTARLLPLATAPSERALSTLRLAGAGARRCLSACPTVYNIAALPVARAPLTDSSVRQLCQTEADHVMCSRAGDGCHGRTGAGLSSVAVMKIARSLHGESALGPWESNLTCLDISANPVGCEGAAALGEALEVSQLDQLFLADCGLDDEDAEALARGMARRCAKGTSLSELGA